MANEDMTGHFLGGGSIRHVVAEGDIFLHAEDVAKVLYQAGSEMGIKALTSDDKIAGATAYGILHVGLRTDELRGELLKREAEKSLNAGPFSPGSK